MAFSGNQTTSLGLIATPSKPKTFTAKAEAALAIAFNELVKLLARPTQTITLLAKAAQSITLKARP